MNKMDLTKICALHISAKHKVLEITQCNGQHEPLTQDERNCVYHCSGFDLRCDSFQSVGDYLKEHDEGTGEPIGVRGEWENYDGD